MKLELKNSAYDGTGSCHDSHRLCNANTFYFAQILVEVGAMRSRCAYSSSVHFGATFDPISLSRLYRFLAVCQYMEHIASTAMYSHRHNAVHHELAMRTRIHLRLDSIDQRTSTHFRRPCQKFHADCHADSLS